MSADVARVKSERGLRDKIRVGLGIERDGSPGSGQNQFTERCDDYGFSVALEKAPFVAFAGR